MALDPLLSPKPSRVTADSPSAVRVKALSRGVYGGIVREPGDVFYVDGLKHKPERSAWMYALPEEKKPSEAPAAKPLMP